MCIRAIPMLMTIKCSPVYLPMKISSATYMQFALVPVLTFLHKLGSCDISILSCGNVICYIN